MLKYKLYPSIERGTADYGWLKARYSFSFASFQNKDNENFGALRVLNDDQIDPGKGFDFHPHNNMEIITIPLSGNLIHKDNMGNSEILRQGQIQVMSAGSGLFHSEYNGSNEEVLKLLQLWIFPAVKNISPRYAQADISDLLKRNNISILVQPFKAENNLWINQQAWISMLYSDPNKEMDYQMKIALNGGVYCFVIEGDCTIAGQNLTSRDAIGIWNTDTFSVQINTNTTVLFIEIPMNL